MSEPLESIQRLGRAYYAIPAGEPSTEQVLEQLPDLYAAIEELLTETDQYSGLLAALGNAREQGYPIHVATRTTCAEHIEQGDDKRDNLAFAGRAVQDDGLPDACPICGGCQAEDQLRGRDARHLQALNDREEACRLLTGLLDAFDGRWTAEKRPPPIYYKAEHFLDRMLSERLAAPPLHDPQEPERG